MNNREVLEYQWPYLLSYLQSDESLDVSARRFGALTRRRQIRSAEQILRLALAYGFCGLSLRQTAAWAESAGIASISDVALLKRLRKAAPWLSHLVATKLAARSGSRPRSPLQLVLVDASTVNAPGNTGIDWRIHLGFDLASFQIRDIELTDVRGGEALRRCRIDPGDVVVADRGYSRRTDLAAVSSKGGDFLVRLNWKCVPLVGQDGKPFDLIEGARQIPEAVVGEFDLKLKPDPRRDVPSLPIRLIVVRKTEAAAAVARQKVLRRCSKQQTTPDPRTLEMAAYVFIATSLPTERLSAEEVLEVYRFRWQVELVFKRLKSLIDLDGLPAKDVDLAKAFIYSKILAALLLDDFTNAFISFSPWGFVVT